MATERLAPDTVADSSNYTSLALSSIQDDPDSPDGLWGSWDGNGNTTCRTTFPTPTGPPTAGQNQEFRVLIRKAGGTNTPDWSLELWENGAQVRVLATGSTTSSSEVVAGTWTASELATSDGSNVEVALVQTGGGTGGPSARAGVEVGAVEWNVIYDSGQNVTGATIASGSAVAVPTAAYQSVTEAISSAASLAAATLAYVVAAATIAAGAAVAAPTLSHQVVAPTIASGSTLLVPTVSAGGTQEVTGASVASGVSVDAPALAYAVSAATLASGSSVAAPTLAGVTVTAAIASGSTVAAPTATHVVVAPAISSTATLSAPTATYLLTTAALASGSTLSAPSSAHVVAGAAIGSTASLSVPTLTEAFPVTAGAISTTFSAFAPTLAPGPVTVSASSLASSLVVLGPNKVSLREESPAETDWVDETLSAVTWLAETLPAASTWDPEDDPMTNWTDENAV